MRKIFLVILLIGFSLSIKALEIQNIAISANSDEEINICVNTRDLYTYAYNSFQYNIEDNTITLEICFTPGIGAVVSYLKNNFQIPINTINAANYLVTVKVYYINMQGFICDYQTVKDVKNLSFSTPISDTIYLITNLITQKRDNPFLYPNPTNGIIFFDEKKLNIDKIEIYDILGRIIKKTERIENRLDLNNLENGIYFIKFEAEKESIIEKIVLKK